MADIYLWIFIVILFIGSFIGLLFPIIPSSLFIWAGFFVYHFTINSSSLGWVFWTTMAVFTIVLLLADIVANSYFVKRFGGSELGKNVAAAGVIIGSFFPPFGIVVLPFLAVIVVELLQRHTLKHAMEAAIGSFIGFLGGTIAKIIIQIIMLIWFVLAIVL